LITVGHIVLRYIPKADVLEVVGNLSLLAHRPVASLTAKVITSISKGVAIYNAGVFNNLLKASLNDPEGQVNKLVERFKSLGTDVHISNQNFAASEVGTLEKTRSEYWLESI
jgi:hypothetical protein